MEIYDAIVLMIVAIAAFFGWRKGLASQIASIVSIVASYFVAMNFREPVAAQIDALPPWNTYAAMLLLFLGTSFVIWLMYRSVQATIDNMKLGGFDHQMGALFGAFKGFLIACFVTLLAIALLREHQRQAIVHSRSGYVIARFLRGAHTIMPPDIAKHLSPYLQRLDHELGTPPTVPGMVNQGYPGGYPGNPTPSVYPGNPGAVSGTPISPGAGYPPGNYPPQVPSTASGQNGYPGGGYQPPAGSNAPVGGFQGNAPSGGYNPPNPDGWR